MCLFNFQTQYAYVYETILEAIMCKPGVSFSCEVYIQNNMQYKMDLDRVRNEYEVCESKLYKDKHFLLVFHVQTTLYN